MSEAPGSLGVLRTFQFPPCPGCLLPDLTTERLPHPRAVSRHSQGRPSNVTVSCAYRSQTPLWFWSSALHYHQLLSSLHSTGRVPRCLRAFLARGGCRQPTLISLEPGIM